MKRILILVFVSASTLVRAGDFSIDGRTFRVPDGFMVERVAGPPLVDRPIVADFDELGRLYVADSSGSNEDPKKQLANPTHRIVRLEDTNGDGKYDKSVVFADKMMFPAGAMWRDSSLYIAAPPSIWKLTDTDGDGICDKREEWFKGKTLTGCANDLHGPYNGPDGWIYWTKGAFAEQTYTLPSGKPFKTRAAHIFRAKPDGTGIERVMTGGMDNPVEVAWSPEGEMFFTTTFLQHPGGGKRDGIIHATYGGVWGKDHDVLDGHIRTGPDLSPVMTHLGPAAPSGLMRYESTAFGTAYKDNLFCAQFNMHKVSRHVLVPDGATFKTIDSDFLTVVENQDFHPTDVLEDADGSLLVLDTGGWYKLCCPTSQIGKPDVLGAIYRVRRINAEAFDDPRGLKIDWVKASFEDLFKKLDDSRAFVKKRAIETLGRSGPKSAEFLFLATDREVSMEVWRNALWAAARIPGKDSLELARTLIMADDTSVRQVAWHLIGNSSETLNETAVIEITSALDVIDQHNRPRTARIAVEAAAHIRLPDLSLRLKSTLYRYTGDRAIEQACIRAMIDQNNPAQLNLSLKYSKKAQAAAILTALDQLGEPVPLDRIQEVLECDDSHSRDIAEWIVERHSQYAEGLADWLATRLDEKSLTEDKIHVLVRQLARFSNSAKIRLLLGDRLRSKDVPRELRLIALQAASKSGLKNLPDEWRAGLTFCLASEDPEITKQAIATARALPSSGDGTGELIGALKMLADRKESSAELRLDALASMPNGPGSLSEPTFSFLGEQLDPEKPVSMRLNAADVLAKAKLTTEQMMILADSLKTAGPLDRDRLLAAFNRSNDEALGKKLVVALKESRSLNSMRIEELKPRFAKFGKSVQADADVLYSAIEKGAADQKSKLDEFTKSLPEGEIRRGQLVFNGTKTACASCHAIGYIGGSVGPDLSRIGSIRNDRDLLEAIVFPSASFVRSYEPMIVATKGGQVHSGVLRKDSPDEVILVTGPDKEVRIPRSDVEEMKPGTVSVMPSGLDSQMSKQDLADLIVFLKSRK